MGANLLNFGVINEYNLHNVEDFLRIRFVWDGLDVNEKTFIFAAKKYESENIVCRRCVRIDKCVFVPCRTAGR